MQIGVVLGFTVVVPPVLIKSENMRAMGCQAEEKLKRTICRDDLYLVGTAEQAIGPMHRDETLDLSAGPRRYLGFQRIPP